MLVEVFGGGAMLLVGALMLGCGLIGAAMARDGAGGVLDLGSLGDAMMSTTPIPAMMTATTAITRVLQERSGILTESGASIAGKESRASGARLRSVVGIGRFGGCVSKSWSAGTSGSCVAIRFCRIPGGSSVTPKRSGSNSRSGSRSSCG